MQRCASCGAENRDIARYCASCGQRLSENGAALPSPPHPGPAVEQEVGQPQLRAEPGGVLSEDEDEGKEAGLQEHFSATEQEAAAPSSPGEAATGLPVSEREPAVASYLPQVHEAVSTPPATPNPEHDQTASDLPDEGLDEQRAGSQEMLSARAEALPPLEPGAKVADRWQITALQESAEERNTYLALDLAACPLCGSLLDSAEDYCPECGVQLSQAGPPPTVTLQEAASANALAAFGPHFVQSDNRLYVAVAAEPAAPADPEPRPLALMVGYASDRGLVREQDEDSVFVFTLAGVFDSRVGPSLGLFIVADGMGGHEGGELASTLAVRRIADGLIDNVLLPFFKDRYTGGSDGVKQIVRSAVIDANLAVQSMAAEKGIDAGTTVTLALVMDGEAYIANVGDSRTYLFREGKLRQVTNDHSLVASLVMAGALEPDEVYTHPQRNQVYRSLGVNTKVEVDQFYELLQPGDALVLCCDGIWEAVRPEGIEEVLLAVSDPQAACNELVRRGNAAGGDDNLSAIVVRVNS